MCIEDQAEQKAQAPYREEAERLAQDKIEERQKMLGKKAEKKMQKKRVDALAQKVNSFQGQFSPWDSESTQLECTIGNGTSGIVKRGVTSVGKNVFSIKFGSHPPEIEESPGEK